MKLWEGEFTVSPFASEAVTNTSACVADTDEEKTLLLAAMCNCWHNVTVIGQFPSTNGRTNHVAATVLPETACASLSLAFYPNLSWLPRNPFSSPELICCALSSSDFMWLQAQDSVTFPQSSL